jgi:peptidoglycan/LPS O-acetylase OafA/YrhL
LPDNLRKSLIKSIADSKIYHSYLDGLRGIATLMVVAIHTSQMVGNVHYGSFACEIFRQYINEGARGVQLFFLLSAFTLFASSHKRFMTELSPKRNFYIRRVFRIMPLWWLMVSIYYFKDHWTLPHALPSFLMYFGFIRYMPHSEVHPIGWTIFVEVTFYILLPLLFMTITDLRKSVIFLLATMLLAKVWVKYAQPFGIPDGNSFITMFPFANWYCFAGGIVLYFIHQLYGSKWLDKMARTFEVLTIVCFLLLFRRNHFSAAFTLGILFLTCMSSKTIFGKIVRIGLLRQFGICCYSIYLLHILVLQLSEPLKVFIFNSLKINQLYGDIKFLIWFPMISIVCLILGLLIFYLVEKPSVNLGKKVILLLENRRNKSKQIINAQL